MHRYLLPLGVFLVLVVFLAIGLRLNPREVPSPLIGKPAPAFRLSQLHEPEKTFEPADLRGRVWLLNVWASWCVSCRKEHPLLVELASRKTLLIVGLNYKDDRGNGSRWLTEHGGDPYVLSAFDSDGRVGIDYGVYGVPETFLIDQTGVIRHKHIGPLTRETIEEKILPLIRELERG
jgi:cytochrome c biogenesis protein CcmG, thiol:disulfide interchange protein DsbE